MLSQEAALRNLGWFTIAAAFLWLLYLLAPMLLVALKRLRSRYLASDIFSGRQG